METLMLADYCDSIDLFARDNATTSEHLRVFKSRNKDRYDVDTARFYTRKGNPIPGGMYSLFGKYNGLSEDEVRENLVVWATDNREMIIQSGKNVLDYDHKDYAWWSLTTTSRKNPCDEIALWCLCKQYYRHAVVYTPEHTWTTLQDKTLSVEQIDKVCDLHFVYMGYGKFGHITHKSNDLVKTAEIQPVIQSMMRKVLTDTPVERPAINRTRHGHRPQRTTSVHMDYCNLNKGLDPPKVKSPTKSRKRKSTTELTLREPSANRIASQNYIPETQEHTLPGQILGSAVKEEDIKRENENDEQARYHAILGDRKKRKMTAPKNSTATPQETKLYTHSHGHTCSRPNCTPVVVSKPSTKPNRPSTSHTHLGNMQCQRMIDDNAKSTNTEDPEQVNVGETEESTQVDQTASTGEHTSEPITKSINTSPTETTSTTTDKTVCADETTLE